MNKREDKRKYTHKERKLEEENINTE